MDEKIISYDSKWGNYTLTIHGIKAYECKECERLVFEPEEARMMQNITAGFSKLSEMQGSETPDFVDVKEVSDLLKISNQTVYNMIKDGRLPAKKVGREWRFSRREVLASLSKPEDTISIAARGGFSEKDKNFIKSLKEE